MLIRRPLNLSQMEGKKGENGISRYGLSDKWSKTLTLDESDNGIILYFQTILTK